MNLPSWLPVCASLRLRASLCVGDARSPAEWNFVAWFRDTPVRCAGRQRTDSRRRTSVEGSEALHSQRSGGLRKHVPSRRICSPAAEGRTARTKIRPFEKRGPCDGMLLRCRPERGI